MLIICISSLCILISSIYALVIHVIPYLLLLDPFSYVCYVYIKTQERERNNHEFTFANYRHTLYSVVAILIWNKA